MTTVHVRAFGAPQESSRVLVQGDKVVELTVMGLPHLRAPWPGISTGGKRIPAAMQPRKPQLVQPLQQ